METPGWTSPLTLPQQYQTVLDGIVCAAYQPGICYVSPAVAQLTVRLKQDAVLVLRPLAVLTLRKRNVILPPAPARIARLETQIMLKPTRLGNILLVKDRAEKAH
jgi:hypothetical protein